MATRKADKEEEKREFINMQDVDPRDIRFDENIQVWINSSSIDRFKGHVVVPQRLFQGVSKFTGQAYLAVELYDKENGARVFMKLGKVAMRALVDHAIYSAEDLVGFDYVVDCVQMKVVGRDMCLPVLKPTEETLKKIREMRQKEREKK